MSDMLYCRNSLITGNLRVMTLQGKMAAVLCVLITGQV